VVRLTLKKKKKKKKNLIIEIVGGILLFCVFYLLCFWLMVNVIESFRLKLFWCSKLILWPTGMEGIKNIVYVRFL
jgi:flagellar basal body-associated protein FliL